MATCGHGGTVGSCDLCKQEAALNTGRGKNKNEGREAGKRTADHQRGKPKGPRKKK